METLEDKIKKAKEKLQETGLDKIEFEFAGSVYKIEK